MRDDSAEILFHSFLREVFVSSSALDWDVHFPLVHQTVSLPTAVSPTFQGSLKHDSGEALVARDMSEPCPCKKTNFLKKIIIKKITMIMIMIMCECEINVYGAVSKQRATGSDSKIPYICLH